MTIRARRILLPLLAVGPALALLVGLGLWQLERLAWKAALLARLDEAAAAPAVPLPADPAALDRAAWEFRSVRATGRFRHEAALHYGAASGPGGQTGPLLLTPLLRAAGPPLLVQRGWVPEPGRGQAAAAAAGPVARPEGTVAVEGYLRWPAAPGWFTPANDAAGNRWFSLDPPAMARAAGLPVLAPVVLVALDPAAPRGALPWPAAALPRPRNDHLGYALSWFGLALGLLAVYGVWAARAWRGPARPPPSDPTRSLE